MEWLEKYNKHAYALLRIAAGYMFSLHGIQKLFGVLTDQQPPMWSQAWFGGVIELVGGILIMVGLFTNWAAFIASGEMAVAYFQFHWRFRIGNEIFPVINAGELAALYCFIFLYIATRGGVMWCIDKTDNSEFIESQ